MSRFPGTVIIGATIFPMQLVIVLGFVALSKFLLTHGGDRGRVAPQRNDWGHL